jgi:methionine-gamma-lyase
MQWSTEYGFGGMMTLDVGSLAKANALMELMQSRNLGIAVSLGFYKHYSALREPLLRAKFL